MGHFRPMLCTIAALCGVAAASAPSIAADDGPPRFEYADATTLRRTVQIGAGRSTTIDLPEPARDTYVADQAIASVTMPTTRRLFIAGLADGSTTIIATNADGRQIAVLEVRVTRDTARLASALRAALPTARISVEAAGDTVILSGAVPSAADATRAVDIARAFVSGPEKVVNAMTTVAKQQVMLKVTVAEVQRSTLKQLGVNATGSWEIGDIAVNAAMSNPYGVAGSAISDTFASIGGQDGTATIQAMQQTGVARLLAEPTLTARSGETATFVVGGQVPVPTGLTCSSSNTCQPNIDYKPFGVSLTFTPVVLDSGHISLRVATEVSETDNQNQLTYTVGGQQISVPGFKMRKQETVVELPSGGTLMTAGLIQEGSRQAFTGIPGAIDMPILGALFRSRDYQRAESELVITVQPLLARPMEARQAARPDQGFADAPDPRAVFFGQVNRIVGDPRHKFDPAAFFGHAGFILD
ncbi:type II and III secretion system protein family protein [Xanthobacter sp. V13C-7B]|uniref:type II and III secretion system protein family protein n=1 Tax=Xanthobacter variabilis TaxID=3119932 RepID=UPI0037267E6E